MPYFVEFDESVEILTNEQYKAMLEEYPSSSEWQKFLVSDEDAEEWRRLWAKNLQIQEAIKALEARFRK